MNSKCHISVVIPVYGRDLELENLFDRLVAALTDITEDFEIILVNDASPDNAWEVITALAEQDSRLIGINLSRNFGQHRAITAGLDASRGDWTVVMDCDLQDMPEEIPKLYDKATSGSFDLVMGRRLNRMDPRSKIYTNALFYWMFSYMTDSRLDGKLANFGIYSRETIQAIKSYRELNASFGLIANIVGFKRAEIEVTHAKRQVGKSSYTWKKLLELAFNQIISHSTKPLKLLIGLGFAVASCSFFLICITLFQYFFLEEPLIGWTSTIISIYLVGGINILVVGFVGLYVGKIFDEVRRRPLYIVQSIATSRHHTEYRSTLPPMGDNRI